MMEHGAELNLLACWAGVLIGILAGMLLGLGFHREDFLGGYGSSRRRLYRLAHIACFGLAGINALFWLTVRECALDGVPVASASLALLIGAAAMPLCCLLTAHWPRARHGFAVPVVALLYGAGATLFQLLP